MKNFVLALCGVLALMACSDKESDKTAAASVVDESVISDFSGKTFEVSAATAENPCGLNSETVCAVEDYIACSINPSLAKCAEAKDFLPSFVFMNDESLERPTWQKFEIVKVKPLASGEMEIYATSTCDGKWFGLCQGNIIFVLTNKNSRWFVKDVYARENF